MPRADLLKSSGFRISVLFLGVFLLAAAIAGSAAFLVISGELRARHERNVEQEYALFADLYRTAGLADLVATLGAHIAATEGPDRIFLLLDADGRPLATNIAAPTEPLPDLGEVSAARLGITADYTYFVKSGKLGPLTLVVGSSAEDISEVEEVFYAGAFWAALVLVVISLAGGVALSTRVNRRIAEISSALQQISDGRFDVRIPKSGSGDDIDRIATLMDEATARLGAAVETNRQISTDIAHDLKTPMNRLRIGIERALENIEAGRPVAAELAEIDGESHSILSTFDALLRIAQIESGARKARFGRLDVGAILANVGEFYEAHAEDLGTTLTVDVADALPPVSGDRELLSQLVANLVENALKHTAAGARIACRAANVAGGVSIIVADDGPGIPEPERDKVLRRLYRLEKSRTTPGSGLGLSMVKAIADLHGARLTLGDNAPGLVVTVTFPFPASE